MTRLGVAFLGEPDVPTMVRLACRAEDAGYDSVWVTETRFTRDAMVPSAAIAHATSRVRIGTGVVNVYTRAAVLMGVSFATLDELSGGRVILGVGPGSPLILEAQGLSFDAPLQRLREYVESIRELLKGLPTRYAGRYVQVRGAALDFTPPRERPPIYLGVTGPRALELAGEIGDGVLLNAFLPRAYYTRALERLEAGRKRSEDPSRGLDVAACVVCSMDENGSVARDRMRPLVATYLARFPNIARETGYPQDGVRRLRDRYDRDGVEAAAGMVDDEWVDALTVAGTPAECREKIERYRGWGVDEPVVVPVANLELTIEQLAPGAQ